MSLIDRWNSFINGGFPDTLKDPLCSSSLEEELEELGETIQRLLHDIEHTRADRAKDHKTIAQLAMQNAALRTSVQHLEEKLVAAEAELIANGVAE